MKVVFINAYQGRVNRGAETYVFELAKKLSKSCEVEVISGKLIPQKRWPLLWRLFIDPSGLNIIWFTLKNISKIFANKYDVVIPLNGGWQSAILRLLTWIYGGKMVISGQSGIGWDDANNLWCFPDVFVGLSAEAVIWSRRVNPFVKVVYIPNGVDVNIFNKVGKKLTTKLKKPIVLCVAALTQSKRIELTIKAVSLLKGVGLLIVGDGEMKNRLIDLGNDLLKNRFQLIKLPFGEMHKVYRSADVFTLVSEPYHSFEMAIVEAMATNLPVVVNNDPIRKEIVGEAGIFVDPENTQMYADALRKSLLTKWGDIPRRQAEKYSWESIAMKYEEIFRKILNIKQITG